MNSTPSSPPSPVSSQPSRKRQRSNSMLSDISSSSVKRSLSDGPSQDGDPLSTLSISDPTPEADSYMAELDKDTFHLAPTYTASFQSVPPAEKVERVESAKAAKMNPGETWFVIDRTWWKRWKKACTGVVDKEGAVAEDELRGVDNTALVDLNGNLRTPLSDSVDFELVPEAVWNDFVTWYGEPKWPLPREVISRGEQKVLMVELYPLRAIVMRMVRTDSASSLSEVEPPSITISSAATVSALHTALASRIRPTEVADTAPFRVWKVGVPRSVGFPSEEFPVEDLSIYECEMVDGSSKSLEEAGFMQGDNFVVEFKDSEGWLVSSPLESMPPPLESAATIVPDVPLFPSSDGFFARMGQQRSSSPMKSSSLKSSSSPFSAFTRNLTGSSVNKTVEPGTLGLGNMGNTCFMNSALQCLAHEPELADYFLNGVFQQELNPDNPLGMHGAIAEAFGALLQKIWAASGPSTSYSPREFKTQLQRFAPQFSGYQQHDSQELVAFLLDGLHEDLNRVHKKPYVEKPDWEGGGDRELVELAQKSWDGYMLRNDSVIVDLFQGQYQSTLVCPECHKVSITFDPFMYLTLPLPVQKKWKHNIFYVPWDVDKPHVKVPVDIGRDASFKDLRQLLGRWLGVPPDNLLTLEVFSHKFFKSLDDGLLCGEMAASDNIVCYELPCHAQQNRTYRKQPDDPLILPVYLCESRPPARNSIYPTTYSHHSISHFGHPTIAVIDQKQATDVDAIYDAVVGRLERWSNNARDLFKWEVAPGAVADVPIQINGVPPVDSLVEIKVNGDVVEHPFEAPEGDITDEKSMIVVEDEDIQMEMEAVAVADGVPVRVGPKRDIFQLKLQPNTKEYGTTAIGFTSKLESFDARVEEAATTPVLLREGDVLMCEFDENMKAYYFGDPHRYEDARWDKWGQFLHPEFEESQREAEEKKNKGISLQDCMDEFTKEEQLGEDDLWYCPQCKKHQQATKKFDLWKAPDVLVVHLKRFSNSRTLRDKIDAFVDFPVDGLDLGDMIGERAAAKRLINEGVALEGLQLGNLDEPLIYDLFGVDEHMGGLGGGHYRAYALNHANNTWYHFDDSYVTPARPEDSVNTNAYLLFYRRRTTEPLGGKTQSKVEAARLKRQTDASETSSSDELITLGSVDDPADDLDLPGLTTFLPQSSSSTGGSPPSYMRIGDQDQDDGVDILIDDPLARSGQRFDFPDPSSNKASPASSTEAEGDPEMDASWESSTYAFVGNTISPTWSPSHSLAPIELHSPSENSSTMSDGMNPFIETETSTRLNID
ncbi:hypothetical protein DFH07DRAFT_882362 [Mycena maculata]|uniref:ubiquitinyl hydrolase 1 n=1 Tax=Mycena maculata TaxID=230809 RepID=A0AAD7NJZ3_9AGAR|nr:hypothetical protein DFH07DRAFT_882362 [Mycena maculata]